MEYHKEIKQSILSDTLLIWYKLNKRELPWRKTNDPYKIWLSEVILQQTRVAQGLPYYINLVQNFPSVSQLASASEEKVLRLWQGLGYYSRARNMHKCAQLITKQYNGVFPNTYSELLKLPGVGSYTAAAIASICFKEPVAVVDGNVYRVLSRFFGVKADISSTKGGKIFQTLANEVMNKENPHHYNQAIMEFGATHCTPKKPKCSDCPLIDKCYALINNAQMSLPINLKKNKVQVRYFYYAVFEQNNELVLKQRIEKDIWHGLYDFPVLESNKKLDEEFIVHHFLKNEGHMVVIHITNEFKHVLSHQRIYGRFIKIDLKNNSYNLQENCAFYSKEAIRELPKPVLISNYLNENYF